MWVHLPASQHRGKTQMLGNMFDIWASAHICTLQGLTFPSHMHLFTCSLSDQCRNKSKEVQAVTFHCGIMFPAALFRDRELLNLVCSHCSSPLLFSLHIIERRDHDTCTSAREDAQSLVWNYTITPLLQKLESVPAGNVCKDWVENGPKHEKHKSLVMQI